MDFTETAFVCECNHLTIFLSFFNQGAEVLQESNYDVWLAIPHLTLQSLKTNIGFYIACTYWCAFSLLVILTCSADRKHLKGKRIKLLYDLTHPTREAQIDETLPTDCSVRPVEPSEGKSRFTERHKSRREVSEKKDLTRDHHHLDNSIVGSDI